MDYYRLFSGRVQLSLLLPLANSQELLHLRVSLADFDIHHSHGEAAPPTEVDKSAILRKYVDGRHMSIAVSRVQCSDGGSKTAFYESLAPLAPGSLLVSPLHMTIDFSLHNESNQQHHHEEGDDCDSTRVCASLKLSNVEITPSGEQVALLTDCARAWSFRSTQRKYIHLRPQHPPTASLRNGRAWWRYAVAAVCIVRNESSRFAVWLSNMQNSEDGAEIPHGVGQFQSASAMRRRYLVLYRQHLECGLHRLADPKRHARATEGGTAHGLPWQMSANDVDEMEQLHRLLSHDDILTYRVMVHHGLRKAGTTLANLKKSVEDAAGEARRFSLYDAVSGLFTVHGGGRDIKSGIVNTL